MAREDAIEALQQSCNSTQILAPAKSSNSPTISRCPTSTAAVSHGNSGHIIGGAEESSSFSLASNLHAIPTSIHGFRPVAILGRGHKGTVVLVVAKQTGAPFALKIISCRESLDSNHIATAVMDQPETSWPMKTNKKQELGLLLSQVDEIAEHKTTDHHGDHPLIRPSRGDMNEKEILSSLSPHPFLQTLHGHFKSGEHSLLLLDFCSGGDLHTLQHKQPEKRFSETATRFYAAEVLVALEQLHNTGIVYRDLKPENILIQENGHIKLTDFDLSLKLVQARATGRASRPNKESISASTVESDHESYNRQSIGNHLDDSSCRRVENAVIEGDLAVVEGVMPKQAGTLKDMTRFTRLGGCFLLDGSRAREGREEHEDEDEEEADENETADDQPIDAGQYGESKVMETGRVRRIKRGVQRKKEESKIWAAMTSPEKKSKKKPIQQTKSVCFVGTDEYVAPEVLQGGDHSTAMDWWSYGVLLYEMIYGITPFKGKNSYETLRNIMEKEAEFPGMVTSAKNLISQLLVKEASKRPKVEDIKRHGFFRGMQWELLTEVGRPPFIPPPYSMSEFEEKARRHQPFIRFNMSRSSSSSNSSSNHQNSLASWIDEVIQIHQGGSICNSSSSAAASLNSSTSTHTQSSASSALSLSSSGGAENHMNGLHHESTEYMLDSESKSMEQRYTEIHRSI